MARQELAMAFLANKHPAEAAKEFLALIQRQPKDFEAYHFLAQASLMQGKAADAAAQLRASLKLKPDQPDTLNDLAWLLATDPHAEIRQGAEAVKLASRACALTRDQAPVLLGTLAAAYAETGDFEKAAATAKKAHDLAAAQGRKAVADKNLQLLELYRSHKPDREKQ
jgi:cytochrome c-type biogenesis protein CcmH/NrfG